MPLNSKWLRLIELGGLWRLTFSDDVGHQGFSILKSQAGLRMLIGNSQLIAQFEYNLNEEIVVLCYFFDTPTPEGSGILESMTKLNLF